MDQEMIAYAPKYSRNRARKGSQKQAYVPQKNHFVEDNAKKVCAMMRARRVRLGCISRKSPVKQGFSACKRAEMQAKPLLRFFYGDHGTLQT